MSWNVHNMPILFKSMKAMQAWLGGKKSPGASRFAVARKEDRTVVGVTFDSRLEAERYAELRIEERVGSIEGLTTQPRWDMQINGKHYCSYTADFMYLRDGNLIIEDVKSTGTRKDAAYRLRKRAAELQHKIKVTEIIA